MSTSPNRLSLRDMRARVAVLLRRMDWMRGLRAAVALCVPLIAGDLAGIPNLGWAALGGFEAIVADPGGPYRARFKSLATLFLGGGLGVFLGSVVGGSLPWALPVTVLWCFAWSYLAVLGQPFTTAGVLVQVVYLCGVGAPAGNWRAALGLGLLFAAGGLWATLLSLFLWPLDPYRPVRSAVGECYSELASFLGSVAELAARAQQRTSLWHRLGKHHQYRLRSVLERGWEAVAHMREEHPAASAQMNHLVVLLESADMLIARTIALAEHLEARVAATAEETGACAGRGIAGLDSLREAELDVASLLVRRAREAASAARAQRERLRHLPASIEGCLDGADPSSRFLLEQVTQAAQLLDTALESASQVRLGVSAERVRPARGSSTGHFAYVYERLAQLRQGWNFDLLAANFTGRSLGFRHALRVAIVCGVDLLIVLLLKINHGYWLLLTSLIVLQPHVSGTLRRGLQRIGGTVAGGMVSALLAMLLHSQMATAAVLFPCALLSLAILPVSYAAFAFFLTPTFVLAWMPFAGDWQLALVRIVDTGFGALLAVLAMLFLFPAYERERAPKHLKASLAADRRYLAELAAAWREGSRSSRLLAQARRATGLAHNDTEESLERLLTENWRGRRSAQSAPIFVTYLRRFAQGVTTLAALDGAWDWKLSPPVQRRLAVLEQRLLWLEGNIASADTGEAQPWPEIEEARTATAEHPGERQLERLERQSSVLHRQLMALAEEGWLRA